MEESNLLSGGAKQLHEVEEDILSLRENKSRYEAIVQEEGKLGKSIQSLEKEIAEEIVRTTRKRRQEIEDTFDEQLGKIRVRIKQTKEKRDRIRNAKVSERIDMETASHREQNKQFGLDIRTICKQKHVLGICKTKLYDILYFPERAWEYLVLLGVLLLILLVLPWGIDTFFVPSQKMRYLLILDAGVIVLFFVLYFLIGNRIKEKYVEEITEIREIRDKIRTNNEKITVIRKHIKKDRDESTYGLENYDEDLAKLEREVESVFGQQKEALTAFDSNTSHLIASDIKGRSEEQRTSLTADYEKICEESSKTEDKIKALTLKIASQYEPFIGKDFMSCERLDALINILETGAADTISDAIVIYKQDANEPKTK
jgi:uncharacterized protein YdcH (DUF465 family)